MQTIEFETQLKDGVIYLPESYHHWQENQPVKVTIRADEGATSNRKDINRHAGKITMIQDPLEYQNAIRDEWALQDLSGLCYDINQRLKSHFLQIST